MTGADCHSALIKGYKKTFSRLARDWLALGNISKDQYDEIIASMRMGGWTLWRPMLYVIPRADAEKLGRLRLVPRPVRAAQGPEMQVFDLQRDEFDIIELKIV